jgi:hypothetical protein
MKLKDRITREHVKLGLEMKLADARAALAANSERLGVVFDDDRPVTLVALADLEATGEPDERMLSEVVSQLPPGILAPGDTPLVEFAVSGAFAAFAMGRAA